MIKFFEEIQKKIISSMDSNSKSPSRRTPVLSSEIARLSIGENCFEDSIQDIKAKEKATNQSTIDKLRENHKKHMASFMSDESVDKIINSKRKVSEDYKESSEVDVKD